MSVYVYTYSLLERTCSFNVMRGFHSHSYNIGIIHLNHNLTHHIESDMTSRKMRKLRINPPLLFSEIHGSLCENTTTVCICPTRPDPESRQEHTQFKSWNGCLIDSTRIILPIFSFFNVFNSPPLLVVLVPMKRNIYYTKYQFDQYCKVFDFVYTMFNLVLINPTRTN